MPQAKKNEVVKKTPTEMALPMEDMEADALGESGFDEADSDSFAVPFLTILQKLSPQLDRNKGEYVADAEEGRIFNTATFDQHENITVVPCHFRRQFLEWKPRDSGGGFAGAHDVVAGQKLLLTCTKDPKGKDILPNGNLLVDTREHFVLVVGEDGVTERAMISMSSTQMKKSKRWMTLMQNIKFPRKDDATQMFTPPMYSHSYKLATTYESNDQGSWYGWTVEKVGATTPAQYAEAKAFRKSVVDGSVEVKHVPEEGSEKPANTNDEFDDDGGF